METHRVETVVLSNRRIVVDDVPFEEGEKLVVIMIEKEESGPQSVVNPLKGTLLRYDDPFGPAVPPEDWDVLK